MRISRREVIKASAAAALATAAPCARVLAATPEPVTPVPGEQIEALTILPAAEQLDRIGESL